MGLPDRLRTIIGDAFEQSVKLAVPLAERNVARLRRVHPDLSPTGLQGVLTRSYLNTMTASGGAAGLTAVVPNFVYQVPAAVADIGVFFQASGIYVFSAAEISGLHIEDHERRRLLLYSVFLGETFAKGVNTAIPKTARYWGTAITRGIPNETIQQMNRVLGPRFITKTGEKTGVFVIGKQTPLLIGAGLGAVGNRFFAHGIVKATKKILPPAPENWPTPDTLIGCDSESGT